MREFFANLLLLTLQICGNPNGTALLLNVANGFEYLNGKVTDTIVCQKYNIVCPDNRFLRVTVKVKGNKPIITNEQIQEKGGHVKVTFKNLFSRHRDYSPCPYTKPYVPY